jgi:two-component system nitrate/nitrite response regulator NarL
VPVSGVKCPGNDALTYQFLDKCPMTVMCIRKWSVEPIREGTMAIQFDSERVSGERLRVLVVDDSELFRTGLRSLLASEGFDRADSPGGAAAIERVRTFAPHVVLMDLRMPGMSGIEATRLVLEVAPATAVMMFTGSDDCAEMLEAVRAGASGYLLKDAEIPEIVKAIRAAAAGYSTFAPEVAGALAANVRENLVAERPAAAAAAPPLSAREREVLALLAAGCDNVAIARQLYISPSTVKNHVSRLLEKLGVDNRVQAAGYAIRHGLVDDRFARTGTPVAG